MWTWKEINPSTSWSQSRISGTGGCLRKSLCREMPISLSLLSLKEASRSLPWDLLVLPAVWVVFWAGWGSAVRSALQMCSSSKINCNSKPNTHTALQTSKGRVGRGVFRLSPNLSVLWLKAHGNLVLLEKLWVSVVLSHLTFSKYFPPLQLEKLQEGWISRRVTMWLCLVLLSSFLSPFWYSLGKIKGKEILYMCCVRNL